MSKEEQNMREIFSNRLQSIMVKRNVNQAELSRVLNVDSTTVGKWILQKSLPRMGIIQKLSEYFQVEKGYFLSSDYNLHFPPEKTNNFTKEEENLIKKYRCLKDSDRACINYILDSFSHKNLSII